MARNGAQYFFMVQNIKITVHSSNFYINVIFTVSAAQMTVHTIKCTGTHRKFSSATMNYPDFLFSVWLHGRCVAPALTKVKLHRCRLVLGWVTAQPTLEINLGSALEYVTFVYTPENQKKPRPVSTSTGFLHFSRVLGEWYNIMKSAAAAMESSVRLEKCGQKETGEGGIRGHVQRRKDFVRKEIKITE